MAEKKKTETLNVIKKAGPNEAERQANADRVEEGRKATAEQAKHPVQPVKASGPKPEAVLAESAKAGAAQHDAAIADTKADKAEAAGEADGGAPENRRVAKHPVSPNPVGSSTEPEDVPTGPQGEDIVYRTNDIAPDGTPLNARGFVAPTPAVDGYTGRVMELTGDPTHVDQAAPDEEDVASTPWGAELNTLKRQRATRVEDPGKIDPAVAIPLS